MLGLAPADYDVATDATPDRVSALFRRTAHVGAHFGVVLVKPPPPARPGRDGPHEDHVIEVATFRSDGAYSDRRRPDSITFSDAKSDAQRRDFTVNALFLDPVPAGAQTNPGEPAAAGGTPGSGLPAGPALRDQIVDFVGGLADLDARVLRAVGDPDARLAEDHLRALRAVRLSARLGFAIEPRTAAAISAHARDLGGVSPERIGDEMRRILGHPTRAAAVASLEKLGLDAPMLGPRVIRAKVSGDVDGTAARLASLAPQAGVGECLAAIALDRGDVTGPSGVQPTLTRWRRTLCLSNDEREAARRVLESYFTLRQEFMIAGVARQKRWAVRGGFAAAMRILRVEDALLAGVIEKRVEELARTAAGLAPEPLVTGDDLIGIGLKPGPGFAGLLARLYDAQLEDLFVTREVGLGLCLLYTSDAADE